MFLSFFGTCAISLGENKIDDADLGDLNTFQRCFPNRPLGLRVVLFEALALLRELFFVFGEDDEELVHDSYES